MILPFPVSVYQHNCVRSAGASSSHTFFSKHGVKGVAFFFYSLSAISAALFSFLSFHVPKLSGEGTRKRRGNAVLFPFITISRQTERDLCFLAILHHLLFRVVILYYSDCKFCLCFLAYTHEVL